jgi:hypothetical protein
MLVYNVSASVTKNTHNLEFILFNSKNTNTRNLRMIWWQQDLLLNFRKIINLCNYFGYLNHLKYQCFFTILVDFPISEGRFSQVPIFEMPIDTEITRSAYNLQWQYSWMSLIQSMLEWKYYLMTFSIQSTVAVFMNVINPANVRV